MTADRLPTADEQQARYVLLDEALHKTAGGKP